MKVRIKARVTHYGIQYDVQYKTWYLFWKHYTRCNSKEDAIVTAKNLEKLPKIYLNWQELVTLDIKDD